MLIVARILAASLFTAVLGIAIGYAFFQQAPDRTGICFCLACVGSFVGAIAGTGREIAVGRR